jgi:hypothetical protein
MLVENMEYTKSQYKNFQFKIFEKQLESKEPPILVFPSPSKD